MKSHTNKNRKNFVLGLFALTVFLAGVVAFSRPSWADVTKTQDVDVRFTFNPTLSVTVSQETITISGLASGTTGESEPVTISVATNNESGYYLSATVGEKGGSTDLTREEGDGKFTHLDGEASVDLNSMADSTWGVAYVVSTGDIATSKFTGLPLDGGDEGVTGKKLLDTTTAADGKDVKLKVGAKAGATLATGTYTNKINFYAVTK